MKKILENIEAIRKDKGMNQDVIAKRLGISQSAYSRYFTDRDDLWLSHLLQICDILETPLNDVVTYPEKYVPANQVKHHCEDCCRKDEIIDNLNEYINILKAQK